MSKNLELVKKAYMAWETKDIDTLRAVLHTNYRATIPGGMEIVGIEGAAQCLEMCTSQTHSENEMYIEDGDRIVRIWDMVTTAPHSYRLRMAELNVIEDGKVLLNEAFFDSAAFPEEVQKEFREFAQKQKLSQSACAAKI